MIVHGIDREKIVISRRSFLGAVFSSSFFLFAGCSLTGRKNHTDSLSNSPLDDYGLRNTTKKLIVKNDNIEYLRADRKEDPESFICFLGITDSSGKQMPQINDAIRAQFRESTSYRLVSDEEIDSAVKKAGIKRNDIYIPQERKKFAKALDHPFRYLLSGQVLSTPAEANDPGKPIGDQIVFNLINTKDDEQTIVQDRLASFYNEPLRKKKGLF
jgi:hypothetical protein